MPVERFTWRQMVLVVWAIGWSDFVMKYRGSFLGYLWSFVPMIVRFLVIFHIFRPFMGEKVPYYHLYLFLGLIVWQHFSGVTSGCISALESKSAIIQKVNFPRILLMLAVGCQQAIIFATEFLLFLCFTFFMGPLPGAGYIYLPFLFVQMSLLALGIGMFLSAYSLKFRDISHLWSVVLQVLFWLTPIMYYKEIKAPLSREAVQLLMSGGPQNLWGFFDAFIRLQPLSMLMQDARRVLLFYENIGLPTLMHIGGATAVCLIVFLIGAVVFLRRSTLFLQEY